MTIRDPLDWSAFASCFNHHVTVCSYTHNSFRRWKMNWADAIVNSGTFFVYCIFSVFNPHRSPQQFCPHFWSFMSFSRTPRDFFGGMEAVHEHLASTILVWHYCQIPLSKKSAAGKLRGLTFHWSYNFRLKHSRHFFSYLRCGEAHKFTGCRLGRCDQKEKSPP